MSYLPEDLPSCWSTINEFIFEGSLSDTQVSTADLQTAVENTRVLCENAFATDLHLLKDLRSLTVKDHTLGIVLISKTIHARYVVGI